MILQAKALEVILDPYLGLEDEATSYEYRDNGCECVCHGY